MPGPIYYSGRTCGVLVGTQTIRCGNWSMEATSEAIDVRTGSDSGFPRRIGGGVDYKGQFEGPVDGSLTNPFPLATIVGLVLAPGDGAPPIAGTAIITSVAVKTSTGDAYRFVVNWMAAGPFTGI